MEVVRGNLSLGVDRELLAKVIGQVCLHHGASVMLFDAEGVVILDMPDHDTRRANAWLCGSVPEAFEACTQLRCSMMKDVLNTQEPGTSGCACGGTVIAKPVQASSALFGGVMICLPGKEKVGEGCMGHEWIESFIDAISAIIGENSFKDMETENLSDELSLRYEELSLLYEIADGLSLRTQPGEVIDFLIDRAWGVVEVDSIVWIGHCSPTKFFSRDDVNVSAAVKREGEEIARIAAGRAISQQLPLGLNHLHDDFEFAEYTSKFDAVLSIPVAVDDDVYGAICLLKPPGEEFNSSESMLMTSLARKAAAVIRNAKLYAQINALFVNTVKTLVYVIEGKDAYTRGHSERVTKFSVMLAERLGLTSSEKDNVNWSGLLHDIGKIKIPEAILQKTGKLTDPEWNVIRNHPQYGADMLRPIEQLSDCLPDIRHHHERFDGGGYPDGLKGRDIPLGARIIAVADTFDALTSDRCYRPRFGPLKALDILREVAGTQLDPDVVNALLNDAEEFMDECQSQPGDNRAEMFAVIGVDA